MRANQGHSVADGELNLQPTKPPELLYHGTVAPFIGSVRYKVCESVREITFTYRPTNPPQSEPLSDAVNRSS